jgi:hypothetical protein
MRALSGFVSHILEPIALVCAESLMGTACPLTTLEGRLRAIGGEASHSHDFIGYWIDRLIFYNFPSWVFTVGYVVFAILVTIVFVLAPPRRPGPRISPIPRAQSSN